MPTHSSQLAHTLWLRLTIQILASVTGIHPNRYLEIERAFRAPSIGMTLSRLIGIRFRRLIRKIILRSIEATRRVLCSKNIKDVQASTDGRLSNGTMRILDQNTLDGDSTVPAISNSGDFPKLIFQTWKTKTSLPEKYFYWSKTFREMNPDFAYFLWDDFDNRNFIQNNYPWFLPIYDAYPREIYRVDAVRYFFLYHFGGLYSDMDTECLQPLAPLFGDGDVWLGRMGNDPDFPHSIPNAIMASKPRQEFWLLAIHFLIETAQSHDGPEAMARSGPEVMTGPILLKRTYDAYSSNELAVREMIQGIARRLPDQLQPQLNRSTVETFEPEIWYPIDWNNVIHMQLNWELSFFQPKPGDRTKQRLFPKSFLVTYWSHSWGVGAYK
jgi:mannosyltransferase OCH1-like enzyme